MRYLEAILAVGSGEASASGAAFEAAADKTRFGRAARGGPEASPEALPAWPPVRCRWVARFW